MRACLARSRRCWRRRTRSHDAVAVGQNELFGGASDREALRLPDVEPWPPSDRLQREYEAIGFFLTGHPLDDYAKALKRMKVLNWGEFARSVRAGATAGRTAATVVSRMERRTKTGNKMGIIGLSDPSGQYEAVLFQEGLQQYRDLLEPGSAVLLLLSAEAQGEEVRARIQSVERLDQAAEKVQKIMRIFLRDPAPLDHITRRLRAEGRRRGPYRVDADGWRGGRGEAARPLQGLAADRRRHQGGAGGGDGRGGLTGSIAALLSWARLPDSRT